MITYMTCWVTPQLLDSKFRIDDHQLCPLPYTGSHVQQPRIRELLTTHVNNDSSSPIANYITFKTIKSGLCKNLQGPLWQTAMTNIHITVGYCQDSTAAIYVFSVFYNRLSEKTKTECCWEDCSKVWESSGGEWAVSNRDEAWQIDVKVTRSRRPEITSCWHVSSLL